MTDETKKHGQNDNTPLSGDDNPAAKSARTSASDELGKGRFGSDPLGMGFDDPEAMIDPDDFDDPLDPVEMLKAQLKEMEEQQANLAGRLADAQKEIHRYQAEIQNLHRRREKETEEAGKYAIAKFARDTVEVADNFERAISSVPAEAIVDNPGLKSLIEGVSMTEREFLNVLDRHGVKRISPKDEPFDPHKHQAVLEQDDPSVPAGTVLQVYQAGYIIADRVLRPAMVVVSKGGPKPVKTPASESNSDTEASAASDEAAGDADASSGVEQDSSATGDTPKNGTDQA